MKVYSFDPGGTTGWAMWDNWSGQTAAGQSDFDGTVRMVNKTFFRPGDVIVAERFTINAQTVRKSQQTTALEVIGFLRATALLYEGVDFVLQTPADAKRFSTDARLDILGWTRRPKAKWDHANDALRHLLLYLVKNKLMEPPRA